MTNIEKEALLLLHNVFSTIRACSGSQMDCCKLAALADAAHNIPLALLGHEFHKENLVRMIHDVQAKVGVGLG